MKRDLIFGTAFRAFIISGLIAASIQPSDALGDGAGKGAEENMPAESVRASVEGDVTGDEVVRKVVSAPREEAAKGKLETSHYIEVRPGQTQVLRISGGLPNRIVTPYNEPELVTNVAHDAWAVGGVLYVLPKVNNQVMAGFIQDASGQWAIPVVMEPADIPPQEIVLDDPRFEPVAGGEMRQRGKEESHSETVVELLLTALREQEIPGFRQVAKHGLETTYVGPLRMEPIMSQIRGGMRVDRFQIIHEGIQARRIHEPSFAQPQTVGILVYPPMTSIAPNETATVLVARRVR